MCSTSAKCNIKFLYVFSWRCEKSDYSVVFFVTLLEGALSSVSHLHQLNVLIVIIQVKCMIDFLFGDAQNIVFLNRWWSAFWYICNVKTCPYQLMWRPKQIDINSAVVHWLLLEVQTQCSPPHSSIFLSVTCLSAWNVHRTDFQLFTLNGTPRRITRNGS